MTDEPAQTDDPTTTDEPALTDEPRTTAGGSDIAFRRSAIGLADGHELFVSVGAIGAARADRVSVEMGAVGAVAAGEARVSLAAVGLVAAREARIEQSFARTVIGGRVHLGRGSAVAIVLAGRTDGEGRPLLDWRGGLAAGAVIGLAWLLVRRRR